MKNSITIISLIAILLILTGGYWVMKPNRWEAYYQEKIHAPVRAFVAESINNIPRPNKGAVALDLGAGVGHETLLLLDRGFEVIAVDNQKIAFDFMLKRPEIIKFGPQLITRVSSFEDLNFQQIPEIDVIVASLSIPFCAPDKFMIFWENLTHKIKLGGYFIGNTFDPGFTTFHPKGRKQMTFHTKEQTANLFKKFNILSLKEIYIPAKEHGKYEHYYEIVAQKKFK